MDSINETEKQLIENRTQSFFHYQNPKMKNENSLGGAILGIFL
jgi:hypothetical protein